MNPVYLDNAATTRLYPQAWRAMEPFVDEVYGNPSSIHAWGQRARTALEEARMEVGRLINAAPAGVIFTSGGTESINLGILGLLRAGKGKGRHIITSTIEHPAVKKTINYLEAEGYSITRLPVDSCGQVSVDSLADALRPDTVLVSIMHANNEVGTIQDIPRMAELTRARNIPFHVDAVQSAGKIPVDVQELGIDLLSLSGHKFHGPKGTGVLYVVPGTPFLPVYHGGNQEMGRRPGTENVPGIVGLGVACRLARENLERNRQLLQRLRDEFEAAILQQVKDTAVNGNVDHRVPHISNLSFPGADGEALVIGLDMLGVAASAGSACSSGALEPSPVLKAMQLSENRMRSAVRFSFSAFNQPEEVNRALEIVVETVEQIRSVMK